MMSFQHARQLFDRAGRVATSGVLEHRRQPRGDWACYHATGDSVELFEAGFHDFSYERHFHDSYAIGVTLSGVQRFWCRGTTHDSVPGDVVVIPPGEVHDGQSGTTGGYTYRMFYVSESVLHDVVGDVLQRPALGIPLRRVPVVRDPSLARELDAAWRAARTDASSLAADELFAQACARLLTGEPESAPDGRGVENRATLIRVRNYLRVHVGKRMSMQELAAIGGMSRFQLTRQFQQLFGLPLHAYHMQLRLHEARRRLRAGEAIAAVALELGFADQSHLNRRFKGAFGVAPGAYSASLRAPGLRVLNA